VSLWDHLEALINGLHYESSKMRPSEFERVWHDPIAKLSKCTWFAAASTVAKTTVENSVRAEIKNIIEYYRFAGTLLDADFG
jgi:hypothetical protein